MVKAFSALKLYKMHLELSHFPCFWVQSSLLTSIVATTFFFCEVEETLEDSLGSNKLLWKKIGFKRGYYGVFRILTAIWFHLTSWQGWNVRVWIIKLCYLYRAFVAQGFLLFTWRVYVSRKISQTKKEFERMQPRFW